MTRSSEATSPKLYALIIALVASGSSVVATLLLLVPVNAFTESQWLVPKTVGTGVIVLGVAVGVFFISYTYALLRKSEEVRKRLSLLVRRLQKPEPPIEKSSASNIFVKPIKVISPIGDDLIRIVDTPKTVRLTNGITREHLRKFAEADLEAISQRALDAANVITRDPSVEVNAKVFVDWLHRNGFIGLMGNSRYSYTRLGLQLIKTVRGTRGTPPPTTTEKP